MGEALRALKIPVGKVIASKFHRAHEAAKLLDIGLVVVSADVVEGGLMATPRENKRRAKTVRGLLSTAPAAGKNLVIVSDTCALWRFFSGLSTETRITAINQPFRGLRRLLIIWKTITLST